MMSNSTQSGCDHLLAELEVAIQSRSAHPEGAEVRFLCPAHDDHRPSARWNPTKKVWRCDTCSEGGGWKDLAHRLGVPITGGRESPASGPPVTVAQLAEAKRLPAAFLHGLGLIDSPRGVQIPYRTATGELAERQRLRSALRAKDGSTWLGPKGKSPVPYGRDRLARRQDAGFLIIVEGESDCWAAWHHNVSALGIPGADMVKVLESEDLAGVGRLYCAEEPDQGGTTFITKLRERLVAIGFGGEAFVLRLPNGVEDLADLHKRDPASFAKSLDAALAAAEPLGARTSNGRHSSSETTRPTIQTNARFLREIAAEALGALQQANEPEPMLFQRGSALVRVGADGLMEQLTPPALKGILDRTADFVKVTSRDGSEGTMPARPPNDVVADILSLPRWPFPPLRAIGRAPVFLADGSLLARNGYDLASGLLLHLTGLGDLRSDQPVDAARHLLVDELLSGFPFVSQGSLAHALALLIQPFVRPLIQGPTPLFLVDAPRRGTGKGLLVEVEALVTLGMPAPVMTLPGNSDEVEKRITALLVSGTPLILLDNVTHLRSTHLAAALTAEEWHGRILGKSQIVHVHNQATWVATGNNVELSDELARRTIPIRLDADCERPEERGGFRHPNLPAWARSKRDELVSACLSIVQAWVQAGRPAGGQRLGRYEQWSEVLGGILEVAGIAGFLSDRGRITEEADHETQEWVAFCAAWYEHYAALAVSARDLLAVARVRGLLLDIWAGRSALAAQQRFGHAVAARRDQVLGTFRIRSAGRHGETGGLAYRLERREQASAPAADQTPETPETPGAPDSPGQPEERSASWSAAGVSGVSGVLQTGREVFEL